MYNVLLRNWLIFNILNEKNKYLRNLESYIILEDAAGEKSKIVEAIEVIDKYKSKDKKLKEDQWKENKKEGTMITSSYKNLKKKRDAILFV